MKGHIYQAKAYYLDVIKKILLVFFFYFLCRLVFFAYNHSTLSIQSWQDLLTLLLAGAQFDMVAITYTNILFILGALLPIKAREGRLYQHILTAIYFITNILFFILNLGDTIYFQFTGKRTSLLVFKEFENENPLSFLYFFIDYWHLTLIGLAMIILWFYLYPSYKFSKPSQRAKSLEPNARSNKRFYLHSSLTFFLALPLMLLGLRGSLDFSKMPLNTIDALAYTENSAQATMVLNTPFVILRSPDSATFPEYKYMSDEEAKALFNPCRRTAELQKSPYSGIFKGRNLMIIIWESCSKEWVGALNKDIKDYKGFTPFIDSLLEKSYYFTEAYANGTKSVDAMPSIFNSIIKPIDPFIARDYTSCRMQPLVKLFPQNYTSAFFHNCTKGSMGFNRMAQFIGFKQHFSQEDFNDDSQWDGQWGIWDEPFLQFIKTKLGTLPQPFIATEFTATSHPPFNIPEQYKKRFPLGSSPYHQVIRYTDYALERFFEEAKKEDWYENTVFLITADHSIWPDRQEYKNNVKVFQVPMIFFDPRGELVGVDTQTIVQQADILPTVVDLFGLETNALSFGHNMFNPKEEHFAINMLNYVFQLVKGNYALQFDGKEAIAFYNYKEDPNLKHNLIDEALAEKGQMLQLLQSVLQQFSYRIRNNKLYCEE